jgi:hypothetical protein
MLYNNFLNLFKNMVSKKTSKVNQQKIVSKDALQTTGQSLQILPTPHEDRPHPLACEMAQGLFEPQPVWTHQEADDFFANLPAVDLIKNGSHFFDFPAIDNNNNHHPSSLPFNRQNATHWDPEIKLEALDHLKIEPLGEIAQESKKIKKEKIRMVRKSRNGTIPNKIREIGLPLEVPYNGRIKKSMKIVIRFDDQDDFLRKTTVKFGDKERIIPEHKIGSSTLSVINPTFWEYNYFPLSQEKRREKFFEILEAHNIDKI